MYIRTYVYIRVPTYVRVVRASTYGGRKMAEKKVGDSSDSEAYLSADEVLTNSRGSGKGCPANSTVAG